jgi:uncharacterized membrane protein YdbT with pleckstrin-like domain
MIEKLFNIFKESANSFEGQGENEKVILLLRRFPFLTIVQVLATGLSIVFPIFFGSVFWSQIANHGLVPLFFLGLSLWALISWLCGFYILTMYTLDVWVLTNERIIDATQSGLFNRTISEIHLSRVQDASVHISGILPTAFHYGDLLVQSAGAEEHFKFFEIAHPELVKDAIMHAASSHNPSQRP